MFLSLYCKTLDQETPEGEDYIRVLPWDLEYLQQILRVIEENTKSVFAKSRQMKFTWAVSAYLVYRCLRFPGWFVPVVSQTKPEAERNIIAKMSFIAKNLPHFFWDEREDEKLVLPKISSETIEFPNRSIIQAYPNDPDQIGRGRTICDVLLDEMRDHKDVEGELMTVLAAGPRHRKIIGGSSACKGVFADFFLGPSDEEWKNPTTMRGWRERRLKNGFQAVEMFFHCDPNHDPETEKGKEWYTWLIKERYGGDESSPLFRQEMMIDFTVERFAGMTVFPPSIFNHKDVVFTDSRDLINTPQRCAFYGGFDFGTIRPSCLLYGGYEIGTRTWWVFSEIYKPCRQYLEFCNEVRTNGLFGVSNGNIWADCAMDTRSIPGLDGGISTWKETFRLQGVILQNAPKHTNVDGVGYEIVKSLLAEGRLKIHASCTHLLSCLGLLRRDDKKSNADKIVLAGPDKHAWDALKSMLMGAGRGQEQTKVKAPSRPLTPEEEEEDHEKKRQDTIDNIIRGMVQGKRRESKLSNAGIRVGGYNPGEV